MTWMEKAYTVHNYVMISTGFRELWCYKLAVWILAQILGSFFHKYVLQEPTEGQLSNWKATYEKQLQNDPWLELCLEATRLENIWVSEQFWLVVEF